MSSSTHLPDKQSAASAGAAGGIAWEVTGTGVGGGAAVSNGEVGVAASVSSVGAVRMVVGVVAVSLAPGLVSTVRSRGEGETGSPTTPFQVSKDLSYENLIFTIVV